MIPRRKPSEENVYAFEELRLGDLRGRDTSEDVVVIPVAPVENHGLHLPTGTDLYISDELAMRASESFARKFPATRVVIYPCITIAGAAIRGTGSVKITSRQLRRALTFLCRRFFIQGYRRFVLISAHGGVPHAGALDDVCRSLCRKGARAVAPAAKAALGAYEGTFTEAIRASGAVLPENADGLFSDDLHGGFMETSMMLHVAPHLVAPDFSRMPPNHPKKRWWLSALVRGVSAVAKLLPLSERTRADLAVGLRIGATDLSWIIAGRLDGYCGTPGLASGEIGRVLFSVVSEDIASSMEEVFTRGADPRDYRSSAYLFTWLKRIGFAVLIAIGAACYFALR